MPQDISYKVDVLSDHARDNIGFKNAQGVQQLIPKINDARTGLVVDGVTYPLSGAAATATPLSAPLTVSSADDGKVYESTTAVTVTIPQNLSPKPVVVFIPKGGTITVAVTGAATINGAATSLTRTLANNPAGFVVQPYLDANGYGVSGS